MFAFSNEQEVVDVGGIKFGGQPGENPTVCFGTLFFGKRWENLDEKHMVKAAELVKKHGQLSDKLGVPALVDVYVKVEDAEKKIKFIAEATELPFSIDASSPEARMLALEAASNQGVLERVIYNSINLGITQGELDSLKNHTPACAIILAYNPKDLSVDGRMDMLSTGSGMLLSGDMGLMDIADELGVKKLIDTGATPFGQNSAETLRSIPVVKKKFGLPAGCALHNTLESWVWMKEEKITKPQVYSHISAVTNSLIPFSTGDFIVYGSIENMDHILPSIAFTDKIIAEGAHDYFGVKPSKKHPYNILE